MQARSCREAIVFRQRYFSVNSSVIVASTGLSHAVSRWIEVESERHGARRFDSQQGNQYERY
ncbi:hypothetical protein RGR602_PC00271 (plasmid) [Rhizobium gallicum bv. gallicum R602sp]|uniref:Uncharacterized protein n=1 Tax=Rhizobium gallicum bv. gallicum R602sp TaxID=1041138 RepID=A0A0B4X8H4_9HYPH|nr:hypothetical protein RGR602_PC00271 [Rhizobium gallicum bv. gallicum R602sp]